MKFGYHASQHNQQYTKREEENFTQEFQEFTSRMNESMKSGANSSDPLVQAEIAQHYEFVCQFWKPNKEPTNLLA